MRAYVVETLEGLGYDVIGTAGAEAALKVLAQNARIKLLLTDVVMPGKTAASWRARPLSANRI